MVQPTEDFPSAEPISDSDRLAAIARLHDLAGTGSFTLEQFSASLDQVLSIFPKHPGIPAR